VANPAPVSHFFKQGREIRFQIVAPALLKLHEQIGRVFEGAAAGSIDVRLVREDARNYGPKVRSRMWFVFGLIAVISPLALWRARSWMLKGFKIRHQA